jgi:hypothetical protein
MKHRVASVKKCRPSLFGIHMIVIGIKRAARLTISGILSKDSLK